jgi:hypothetical protein
MRISIIKAILLLGLAGLSFSASAQEKIVKIVHTQDLEHAAETYCSFFSALDDGTILSPELFTGSFEDIFAIRLPRDMPFKDEGPLFLLTDYLGQVEELLNNKSISIVCTPEKMYAMGDKGRSKRYSYTWVTKKVGHQDKNGNLVKQEIFHSMLQWVKRPDGTFKIRNVQLVDRLPADNDHDCIADSCDRDTKTVLKGGENEITLSGRDASDEDGDGVPNKLDNCMCVAGPRGNKGCPNPPSSRFSLGMALGTYVSVDGNFNNRSVVSGNTWEEKGFFARTGFALDLTMRYNANNWAGFSAGVLFMSKDFDGDHLANQVRYYLGKNGVVPENVSVSSKAYQFLIPYIAIRLGNFKSDKYVVSIEPLLGLSFTNIGLLGNGTSLNINYQDSLPQGNEFAPANISFKSKPFPVYGARLNWEILFKESPVRLIGSVSYITGNYEFDRQEIYLPNAPAPLVFEGTQLSLLGGSIGLNINLRVPKHYGPPDIKANRCE